jgi:hypothetical protein
VRYLGARAAHEGGAHGQQAVGRLAGGTARDERARVQCCERQAVALVQVQVSAAHPDSDARTSQALPGMTGKPCARSPRIVLALWMTHGGMGMVPSTG